MIEGADEDLEKAKEELYKEIGYVESDELKFPKDVCGGERRGEGGGRGGREEGREEWGREWEEEEGSMRMWQ